MMTQSDLLRFLVSFTWRNADDNGIDDGDDDDEESEFPQIRADGSSIKTDIISRQSFEVMTTKSVGSTVTGGSYARGWILDMDNNGQVWKGNWHSGYVIGLFEGDS